MKKIGFIGAFEKTDLIVYTAKILTELGKRILIIDTTILQKARYIVPTIASSKFYVTTYEDIDIAVGFRDIESVNEYIGNLAQNYDILLIDIDFPQIFEKFGMEDAEKLYFITAFDNFSLKRGLQILKAINSQVPITKILFERDIYNDFEEYLNLLSSDFAIKWNEEKIYFPYDQGDLTAIIQNQIVSKIKLKNLSQTYRDSLIELASDIEPELRGVAKKIMKKLL